MKPRGSDTDKIAAEWVARLDARGTPQEWASLEAWLAIDWHNRVSFERARAMWTLLDAPASEAGGVETTICARPPRMNRRVAIAGMAAALGVGGAGFLLPRPSHARQLSTGTGEIRSFDLRGRASLQLDTETHVEVDDREDMTVVSIARGAVWFRVLPSGAPPLVVETSLLRLDTRGADFGFFHAQDDVILVSGGRVDVGPRHNGGWMPVSMGAGMRAHRRPGGKTLDLSAVAQAEIDRALAWREGRIELNGTSVIDAAALFNRYNKRKLLVGDGPLAQEMLVGRFDARRPEDFAKALVAAFGARADYEPNLIRITIS
jgi:transmembrane sensor